jgi:hypothetical protein
MKMAAMLRCIKTAMTVLAALAAACTLSSKLSALSSELRPRTSL